MRPMNQARNKRNPEFSRRLFGLWQKLGITQKEFARDLHISENAAGNYLRKGRVPEWDILVRIADYFKRSIDWLLCSEEPGREAAKQLPGSTIGPWAIFSHKPDYKTGAGGIERRQGGDRRRGLLYESTHHLFQMKKLNRAVYMFTLADIRSRLWALENLRNPQDTPCNSAKPEEK